MAAWVGRAQRGGGENGGVGGKRGGGGVGTQDAHICNQNHCNVVQIWNAHLMQDKVDFFLFIH